MKSTEDVLRTVRALFARATASPYPHEAELSRTKAQQLMARHSIEMAMVAASMEGAAVRPGDFTATIYGGYARHKALLLQSIAQVFGCEVIMIGQDELKVFGFEADLDMTWALFESLLVQMETEMFAAPGSTATFRRAFILQYSGVVSRRLKELYQEEVTHSTPGAELVLRDRTLAVMEAVRTAHPRLRSTSISGGDLEGRHYGNQSGNRADIFLAGQRLQGQPQALAG